MQLPNEYKTGNKKLDERIAQSFGKYPHKTTRLQELLAMEPVEKGKPRIRVGEKGQRTYSDGTVFATIGEMYRWDLLLKVQKAGEIKNLRRQVAFELQESFIHKQWGDIQEMIYVADFAYTNISFHKGYAGRECVEDSKGKILTETYKLKRKLFLYKYAQYLFFEIFS